MNKVIHNTVLLSIVIAIFICTLISISYAYYVVNIDNKIDFTASAELPAQCTSVQISDEKSLAISGDYALPVQDSKLLNSSDEVLQNYKYSFTLTNNCDSIVNVRVSIAPLVESTMPIDAMRYVVVKRGETLPKQGSFINNNNGRKLSEQIVKDAYYENGYNINIGYEIQTVNLGANQSDTYDLYLWIDYNEGDRSEIGKNNGITLNKSFMATIIITDYIDVAISNDEDEGEIFSEYIKSLYTSDGANGLYYHDGNGTYGSMEAGDKSYRYVGANPDNYVCFGSNSDVCEDDNLYRIIGVFNNKVKLVKYDYASSDLLGTNGSFGNLYNENSAYGVNNFTYYKGSNLSKIGGYHYYGDTPNNDWETSLLNTVNLNENFLNSIGIWQDMIAETTWQIGGGAAEEMMFAPRAVPKNVYDYELGAHKLNNTYKAKIGLMYLSDYYYAVDGQYWNIPGLSNSAHKTSSGNYGSNYDLRSVASYNWLYMGLYEFFISPVSDNEVDSYLLSAFKYPGGFGDGAENYSLAIRPTFYLKEKVETTQGKGTKSNPYRLSSNASDIITNVIVSELTTSSFKLDIQLDLTTGKSFAYSIDNGTTWQTSNKTSYKYQNLNENTEYTVQVKYIREDNTESDIYSLKVKTRKSTEIGTYIKMLYMIGNNDSIDYHTTALEGSAADGSYRYSGRAPQNYICFGSDAAECPYNNLYRIIGLFDDRVKLIKADFITQEEGGTDGDFAGSNSALLTFYRGMLKRTAKYYKGIPWGSSYLNTINLNTNFLGTFDATWQNLILNNTWHVPTIERGIALFSSPNEVYRKEQEPGGLTVDAKIGLMYLSDYYYGTSPSSWQLGFEPNPDDSKNDNNYSINSNKNWILLGAHEFTISNYIIEDEGSTAYSTDPHRLRPAFYIPSYLIITGGDGTMDSPYRIDI